MLGKEWEEVKLYNLIPLSRYQQYASEIDLTSVEKQTILHLG